MSRPTYGLSAEDTRNRAIENAIKKSQENDRIEKSAQQQRQYIDEQAKAGQEFFRDEAARNEARNTQADILATQARANVSQNIQRTGEMENEYRQRLAEAENVSKENMENARNTYKQLSPYHRDAMERAKEEAGSAMTLREYMDPNNQVMQDVRSLYNTEGEGVFGRYDQQAQNIGRQGLADFGVLSSLGSQAAANAMGGMGPMTVGQQMAQMATANQQAGEAYAATQRRMNALRDMGMSSREALRQAGIERGFERGDRMYEAGRLAQEDLSRRMGEYEGFEDRNINRTTGISDRLVDLGTSKLGSRQREEGARYGGTSLLDQLAFDTEMGKLERDTGLSKGQLDDLRQIIGMRMGREDIDIDRLLAQKQIAAQQRAARDQSQAAMMSSILGTVGTIGGAIAGNMVMPGVGGAVGAGVGGALGGAAGGGQGQVNASVPTTMPTYGGNYTPMQQSAYMSRYNLGVNPYGNYPYGNDPNYGTYRPTVNPSPYG